MTVKTTPRQRWVLALSSLASFMVVLDMLVVATALSAIKRDLHASLTDLEWTVNAYTLSFAVLLMTGAALGDRYGRRRMFAAGLTLFALGSAACALAPGTSALIAARAVQGAGAALIMPLALALLNDAFPPERRGWATGIYGGITATGAVAGPLLGGAITQVAAWEWIFWINLPIGLLAVPLVLSKMGESRAGPAALDLRGLALAAGAALGVMWALVRAGTVGWTSAETVVGLVGGVALGVAFVGWERRARSPMLPLRLLRSRAFSAGNAAIFFVNAALTGVIFFAAQYPQVVLGDGPFVAGLRLLPLGVPPLLVARRVGPLATRFGVRPLIITGATLLTLGTAALAAVISAGGGYGLMIAPLALFSAGFAIAVSATTIAVVSRVGKQDLGKASGTFSTLRQFGGAFGVAVMGAAFAAGGGYASFIDGYAVAVAVAAGMGVAAVVAGVALPAVRSLTNRLPAPAAAAEVVSKV